MNFMLDRPERSNILFVVDVTRARALLGRLSPRADGVWRCLFLAEDTRLFMALAAAFRGRVEFLETGRICREAARDIEKEHVAWIDGISRKSAGDPAWWFTSTASRNIRQSRLFRYGCYLEFVRRMFDRGKDVPQVIIVDSDALARTITAWAKERKREVCLCVGMDLVRRVRAAMSIFRARVKFVYVSMGRILAARWAGLKSGGRADSLASADTLVVTTVHDYSLGNDGCFTDRYFPSLHDFLRRQGRKVAVFPVFYGIGVSFFQLFRRMRASGSSFIIPDDFLAIGDVLQALRVSWRAGRRCLRPVMFNGFDFSLILDEECQERDPVAVLEPLMLYRTLARIGSRCPALRHVIVWYENSAQDKAVIMGLKASGLPLDIVGAQPFLHPPHFHSLSPTCVEVEAGVVPRRLLGTSHHECSVIRMFCPQLDVRPAAALRYRRIFDEKSRVLPRDGGAITICLSYDMDEALEVLEMIGASLGDIDERFFFLIRPHPDHSIRRIVALFGRTRWPARFLEAPAMLDDSLDRSLMVISSASSAMIEAAVRGVPVIFLGGRLSVEDNLMLGQGMALTTDCFSARELVSAIRHYAAFTPEAREALRQEGSRLKEVFFTPVNDATMKPYLEGLLC